MNTVIVEQSPHDLGPEFEPLVMSCILKSDGFYQKYRSVIKPEMFFDPRMTALSTFVEEYYTEFKTVPGSVALADVIRKSNHAKPGDLIELVGSIGEPQDVEYVTKKIFTWIKWKSIAEIDSNPEARTDPKVYAGLVAKASRVGDELLLDHTRLDTDSEDENIRGEIIPTPWEWLNEKFLGGPERGDFGVVITVINGGKTTILVNIAMHAVASGLQAVYFTFEDGEKKVKRRMLQWINGWPTERLISDIQTARKRRDAFLRLSGGAIHIKGLKSRRSTVDDAMAFIRSIEESTGRRVDIVCTDYADRFRPMSKYSEPRHALREIYEDCKFLASELQVVHWTASQAAKLATGKDVVGIEHGSESTGKFESCDFAIGFGRTMEDERRGTINMYTSKVRDGRKSELVTLMADFDTQRIFEQGNALMTPKRH